MVFPSGREMQMKRGGPVPIGAEMGQVLALGHLGTVGSGSFCLFVAHSSIPDPLEGPVPHLTSMHLV